MSIIIRLRKKQVKNLFLNKFDISKLIFSYNISPACHIARATPLYRAAKPVSAASALNKALLGAAGNARRYCRQPFFCVEKKALVWYNKGWKKRAAGCRIGIRRRYRIYG